MKRTDWLIHGLFFLLAYNYAWYFSYLRFLLNVGHEEQRLILYLANCWPTPNQYRVLIPWTIRWLYESTPIPRIFLDNISIKEVFQSIEMFSTFFLIIAFRKYISLFFKDVLKSTILSLSLLCILPFNFLLSRWPCVWYPYDIPAILFFTLGLILLYKQKWTLYYSLFILATFNRETTVFLIFIYLVTAIGKSKIKKVAFHCLLQFAIWLAIKCFLYWLFISNSGWGVYQSQFLFNLKLFSNPQLYPILINILLSNFAYIWIPVLCYFPLIQNGFIKRSLLVIIPFFMAVIWGGVIHELRIYGELIPIIIPAFLLILCELFKKDTTRT